MKKSKMVKLETIADIPECGLTSDLEEALKEVTVLSRIEALLEDMNVEPFSLGSFLEIGDKERRTHVFSASEIGMANGRSLCGKYVMGCGRYLYYCYTNAKAAKSHSPSLRRVFDTGSAIHAQLQMYLEECAHREPGASFESEVDLKPESNKYKISAHMDGLWKLYTKLLKLRFGIEIKSINDSGFKATTKIHDEHATQVTVYQACFDLPVALIVYYNKNDSHISEFVQVFDRNRWLAIKKKLRYVRKHAKDKTPPPHEVSYKCNSCKFKGVCKPPKKTSAKEVRRMFQLNPTTVSGRST